MDRLVIVVAALSLTLPFAGIAQSNTQMSSVSTQMTAHEAHMLMKSANNGAQYKQLAGYFRDRETTYRAKASTQKVELDELSKVNPYRYQKVPRPVDFIRHNYESYVAHADKAASQAQHYDQLAASAGQHDQQLATSPPGKS